MSAREPSGLIDGSEKKRNPKTQVQLQPIAHATTPIWKFMPLNPRDGEEGDAGKRQESAGINRGDLDRSLNSELWGLGMGVRMFPKHNGNLLLRWVQGAPGDLFPGSGETSVDRAWGGAGTSAKIYESRITWWGAGVCPQP